MNKDLLDKVLKVRHDFSLKAEAAWCDIENEIHDTFDSSEISTNEMRHIITKAYAEWQDNVEKAADYLTKELLDQIEINRWFSGGKEAC